MLNFASPFGNLSSVNLALPAANVNAAMNEQVQALMAKNVAQNEGLGGNTLYNLSQQNFGQANANFQNQYNQALGLYNNAVYGAPDQYARALNLSSQYSKNYIDQLANTFNPLIQSQNAQLTNNAYGFAGNLAQQYGNVRDYLNSTGSATGSAVANYGAQTVNNANVRGNDINNQLRAQGSNINQLLRNDNWNYLNNTQAAAANNLSTGSNVLWGAAGNSYQNLYNAQAGYTNQFNQNADKLFTNNANMLGYLTQGGNQFANQAVNEFNQKGNQNLGQFSYLANQDQDKAVGQSMYALTNPGQYGTQIAAYDQALRSAKNFQDQSATSIKGGTDDFLRKMADTYKNTIGRSPYAV